MRPGANGSAATLSSTKTKRKNNGNEIQSEAMVIRADQESLAPRSSPRSRRTIAATSKNAPKKSTRRTLVFQFDDSCSGRFKIRATLRKAAAHIGACARNPLDDISVGPLKKLRLTYHRQLTRSANRPPTIDWCTASAGGQLMRTEWCARASPQGVDDVENSLPGSSLSQRNDITQYDRDNGRHTSTTNACKGLKTYFSPINS